MTVPEPAVTARERLERIVEDRLCIGYGLCESLAGPDSVRIVTVENGYRRPVVVGPLGQETVDLIYDTCPGLRLESLPECFLEAETEADPFYGLCLRMFSGYATDDAIRISAEGRLARHTRRFRLDDHAAGLHAEEYERQKQGTRKRLRNGRNTETKQRARS
ncbi:MAG: hypothetical protein GDA49_09335 [Rhodospirillales bacterium]|nr:hypothetical protein [Rhodospirillales bacterium]